MNYPNIFIVNCATKEEFDAVEKFWRDKGFDFYFHGDEPFGKYHTFIIQFLNKKAGKYTHEYGGHDRIPPSEFMNTKTVDPCVDLSILVKDNWYYVKSTLDSEYVLKFTRTDDDALYDSYCKATHSEYKSGGRWGLLKSIKVLRRATQQDFINLGVPESMWKPEFKVGDMVITQRYGSYNGTHFNSAMECYVGKKGLIEEVSIKGTLRVHGCYWSPSALRKVVGEETPPIERDYPGQILPPETREETALRNGPWAIYQTGKSENFFSKILHPFKKEKPQPQQAVRIETSSKQKQINTVKQQNHVSI